MSKTIALVIGARPNFMKAAPLLRELQKYPDRFAPVLIHTGQHYDANLSQLFFDELGLPQPDLYLGVGSGSHAEQTGKIMMALERVWQAEPPDLTVVFGDVNSTMAAALVAAKLRIPLAHIEAGLRSFDNAMPEEINRIVTDRLSDYLFVSEPSGLKNLAAEGVVADKIFHTGNIMIDSLVSNLEACRKVNVLEEVGVTPGEYVVVTLHRPSNVDNPALLGDLMSLLGEISQRLPVVFPCHPRTRKHLEETGVSLNAEDKALKLLDPIGYLEFLRLQSEAKFVLTDSGGIQEETTYLGIPCITVRKNTERPATVDIGTNILTGPDPEKIRRAVHDIMAGRPKEGRTPEFWDGRTAERIVAVLKEKLV